MFKPPILFTGFINPVVHVFRGDIVRLFLSAHRSRSPPQFQGLPVHGKRFLIFQSVQFSPEYDPVSAITDHMVKFLYS